MLLPLLFGDDTRVGLLQFLARRPEGLSQRALAQKLGRSPSHVNKIVHEFEAAGVVQVKEDRRVRLDTESPLYDAVVDALYRFEELGAQGQLLRNVLRPAKERFGDRFYVGGYLAATLYLDPIDFTSNRCDLYVKGLLPKDMDWAKGLQKATVFDVRLHDTQHLGGFARSGTFSTAREGETLDEVPCLIAYPEVGALQCLSDESFPRYGAFLILVQGIAEWAQGGGGLQPARLKSGSVGGSWSGDKMEAIIGYIERALQTDVAPPADLLPDPVERRELENALNTVRGA